MSTESEPVRLPRDVVHHVADEAIAAARERAVRELSDRLVPVLVAAAAAELSGQPADAPARAPEGPPTERPEEGLYLYAIAASPALQLSQLTGVDGEAAVEVVGPGPVGVVSSIPLDVLDGLNQEEAPESRLAELAQRHDDVVAAVHRQGAALPLRFGVVLRSPAALEDLLSRRGELLRRELEAVGTGGEWVVRVAVPEEAAGEPSEQPAAVASGADYLRDRAARLDRREVRHEELGAPARELDAELRARSVARQDLGLAPSHRLAAVYLVGADRHDDFAEALERGRQVIEEEHGEVVADGPFPPYHFVRRDLLEDPAG